MFPTFRYHPTLAPKGIKFTDEATFLALSDEWVDTPAKFEAAEPEADVVTEDAPKKRGRKAKEIAHER